MTNQESGVPNLASQWSAALEVAPAVGVPWLDALRGRARRAFSEEGLPGNRDEAWKYTSLRPLDALAPQLDGIGEPFDGDWAPLLEEPDGMTFEHRGGRFTMAPGNLPHGVRLLPLLEALDVRAAPELATRLRRLLESVETQGRSSAFEALNTAQLAGGLVLHLGPGVDAGWCIARWALTGRESRLESARLVLLLDAGARLRLLEQFRSLPAELHDRAETPAADAPAGQALNLLTQIEIGEGAHLEQVRIQAAAESGLLFDFTLAAVAAGGRYDCFTFDLQGGLVRHDLKCRLDGIGAQASINGAFLLDGERHVDHHVRIDHASPGGCSEQYFRGALSGRSRGVFNGKAIIHPGADGSRVHQSNANLLLSDLAEMDTKPELEIYADEVEARHGATVGQLDELAVYYLRTRGIDERDARRMLTGAFCRTVADRLPFEALRKHVGELLDHHLPAGAVADQHVELPRMEA